MWERKIGYCVTEGCDSPVTLADELWRGGRCPSCNNKREDKVTKELSENWNDPNHPLNPK